MVELYTSMSGSIAVSQFGGPPPSPASSAITSVALRWSCSCPRNKKVCHRRAMNRGIDWTGKDPPVGSLVAREWKDAFVRHI